MLHVFVKFTKEIYALTSSLGVTHLYVLLKMFPCAHPTLTILMEYYLGGESLILTVQFLDQFRYP